MRLLLSLILLLAALAGGSYALLFTDGGNDLLRPYLEKELNERLPVPAKLSVFTLRPDRFDVVVQIGQTSRLKADGTFDIRAQSINARYEADIVELADLAPLIGAELHGPFKTEGRLSGDMRNAKVAGWAKIAGGLIDYRTDLKAFNPLNAEAKARGLQTRRLLALVARPGYIDGRLDVNLSLASLRPKDLKGKIVTKLYDAQTDNDLIRKDFNLSLPSPFTLKADALTRLRGAEAITRAVVTTPVGELKADEAIVKLPSGAFESDFTLTLPDLGRLAFLAQRPLKGDLTVTGKVRGDAEGLNADAHADTLGGAVDVKLRNNKLRATVRNVQTVALTDMLLYPHVFDSKANVTLDYDLLTRKGEMKAILENGQILPNRLTFLLQQMAKFDITKEIYERTTLTTAIRDKLLISDLYMKSRFTEIKSDGAKVDLKTNTLDTTIVVMINKLKIPVKLSGPIDKPKIAIDAGDLAKARAKKELQKRLPKKLKNSPAGEMLQKLF